MLRNCLPWGGVLPESNYQKNYKLWRIIEIVTRFNLLRNYGFTALRKIVVWWFWRRAICFRTDGRTVFPLVPLCPPSSLAPPLQVQNKFTLFSKITYEKMISNLSRNHFFISNLATINETRKDKRSSAPSLEKQEVGTNIIFPSVCRIIWSKIRKSASSKSIWR